MIVSLNKGFLVGSLDIDEFKEIQVICEREDQSLRISTKLIVDVRE